MPSAIGLKADSLISRCAHHTTSWNTLWFRWMDGRKHHIKQRHLPLTHGAQREIRSPVSPALSPAHSLWQLSGLPEHLQRKITAHSDQLLYLLFGSGGHNGSHPGHAGRRLCRGELNISCDFTTTMCSKDR